MRRSIQVVVRGALCAMIALSLNLNSGSQAESEVLTSPAPGESLTLGQRWERFRADMWKSGIHLRNRFLNFKEDTSHISDNLTKLVRQYFWTPEELEAQPPVVQENYVTSVVITGQELHDLTGGEMPIVGEPLVPIPDATEKPLTRELGGPCSYAGYLSELVKPAVASKLEVVCKPPRDRRVPGIADRCGESDILCNPMVFGLGRSGLGFCTSPGPYATHNCDRQYKREPNFKPRDIARQILANPHLKEKFFVYQEQMSDYCRRAEFDSKSCKTLVVRVSRIAQEFKNVTPEEISREATKALARIDQKEEPREQAGAVDSTVRPKPRPKAKPRLEPGIVDSEKSIVETQAVDSPESKGGVTIEMATPPEISHCDGRSQEEVSDLVKEMDRILRTEYSNRAMSLPLQGENGTQPLVGGILKKAEVFLRGLHDSSGECARDSKINQGLNALRGGQRASDTSLSMVFNRAYRDRKITQRDVSVSNPAIFATRQSRQAYSRHDEAWIGIKKAQRLEYRRPVTKEFFQVEASYLLRDSDPIQALARYAAETRAPKNQGDQSGYLCPLDTMPRGNKGGFCRTSGSLASDFEEMLAKKKGPVVSIACFKGGMACQKVSPGFTKFTDPVKGHFTFPSLRRFIPRKGALPTFRASTLKDLCLIIPYLEP